MLIEGGSETRGGLFGRRDLTIDRHGKVQNDSRPLHRIYTPLDAELFPSLTFTVRRRSQDIGNDLRRSFGVGCWVGRSTIRYSRSAVPTEPNVECWYRFRT